MYSRLSLLVTYFLYFGLFVLLNGKYWPTWWVVPLTLGGGFIGLFIPRATQVGAELFLARAPFNRQTVQIYWRALWQAESEQESRLHVSHLIHSYLFLFAYFAAAFFVVTSTADILGKAVVLGCGLRLCWELVGDWRRHVLVERWFGHWQAKLSTTEMNLFVGLCMVGFLGVSLLGAR